MSCLWFDCNNLLSFVKCFALHPQFVIYKNLIGIITEINQHCLPLENPESYPNSPKTPHFSSFTSSSKINKHNTNQLPTPARSRKYRLLIQQTGHSLWGFLRRKLKFSLKINISAPYHPPNETTRANITSREKKNLATAKVLG